MGKLVSCLRNVKLLYIYLLSARKLYRMTEFEIEKLQNDWKLFFKRFFF